MATEKTDYRALMRQFSIPRANGSREERDTATFIRRWLDLKHIGYVNQSFSQYPYFMLCIGLWLILSRTLLSLAIWLHFGWLAFIIGALGLVAGSLDVAKGWPLVTWPGRRRGENIIIEFAGDNAAQEVLLCCHYDSKTELFDHRTRRFFTDKIRLGIVLTLSLMLLGPVESLLREMSLPAAEFIYLLGVLLSLPMLVLAWGLGLNLSLGRAVKPSQGAVDNGAACAMLLALAGRLKSEAIRLQRTQVTIAMFTAEEENMQGSRSYVHARDWTLPAYVVNLELMGQHGGYLMWAQDGDAFVRRATSDQLNADLEAVIRQITGIQPRRESFISSDAYSFIRNGLPTAVLGTYDEVLGVGGLHRPTDNIERIDFLRLAEGVDILQAFIQRIDARSDP